jgi:hypothetical protein
MRIRMLQLVENQNHMPSSLIYQRILSEELDVIKSSFIKIDKQRQEERARHREFVIRKKSMI